MTRQRAITSDASDFGHFRLTPYTDGDHEQFFRPDGIPAEALDWIRKAKDPILYLAGKSGTGKTSLLNAWLVPELAKVEPETTLWVFNNLDSFRQMPDEDAQAGNKGVIGWLSSVLAEKLNERDQEDDQSREKDGIRKLLARAAASQRPGRLIVAIDQFGSSILLQSDEEKAKFRSLFESLQQDPITGLQLLLILRFDNLDLSHLRRFGLPQPTYPGNRFNISALMPDEAAKLLDEMAGDLTEDARSRILQEAQKVDRGTVRPVTLNLIGRALQRISSNPPSGRVIEVYLRDILTRPGFEETAPRLIEAMMRDGGIQPVKVMTLADDLGMDVDLIRKILTSFVKEGLVRALDSPTNSIFEISHDFVAEQLDNTIRGLPDPYRAARIRRVALSASAAAVVLIVIVGLLNFTERFAKSQLSAIGAEVRDLRGAYHIALDGDIGQEDATRAVSYMKKLNLITEVTIRNTTSMRSLPGLGQLPDLKTLTIENNNQLQYVDDLAELSDLQNLLVQNNNSLVTLEGLSGLQSLTSLFVQNNGALTDIKGLSRLSELEQLSVINNDRLESLDGLEQLAELESLNIKDNSSLETLPSLGRMVGLQTVLIQDNELLQEIDGLENADALERLWIKGNNNLAHIPALGKLDRLNEVAIGGQESWLEGSLEILKGVATTTQVRVSRDYIRRGWVERLNAVRAVDNLPPARVTPW
ncbi:MAG: leucine-rich repeat domain-containing protein [Geminicoccaceae bacterium]